MTERRRMLLALVLAICLGGGASNKTKNKEKDLDQDQDIEDEQTKYVLPQGQHDLNSNIQDGQILYALPQENAETLQSVSVAAAGTKKTKQGDLDNVGGYAIYLTNGGVSVKPKLVWQDEFVGNGSPDENYWGVGSSSKVYTAGHELRMGASSDSTQTITSRLTTSDRVTFTYGILEARIKVPDMSTGLWSAFWIVGHNSSKQEERSPGELAIMEMGYEATDPPTFANHVVRTAVKYDSIGGNVATYNKAFTAATALSQDYHIYRLEWTPETMTTYVDDDWIWEMDINPATCPDCQALHLPHHINLNLGVGGRDGCIEGCQKVASGEMLVDYIRLYDNGYSKGTVNGHRDTGSWYGVVLPTPAVTVIPGTGKAGGGKSGGKPKIAGIQGATSTASPVGTRRRLNTRSRVIRKNARDPRGVRGTTDWYKTLR